MILLDPDMDPDPALSTASAKPTSVSGLLTTSPNLRTPSARTLARFLSLAQAAVRLRGEVSILLTTDAGIRKLNRQFRGKNKATDVLSFPAEGIGSEEIAGDLAISVPTALRQAVEQHHSLSTEIKVLILHGLLHLAGYDHEADAGKMARRERQLRAKLGLPQGLIERAGAPERVNRASSEKRASGAKQPAEKRPISRENPASRSSGSKQPAENPRFVSGHGFSRAAKAPKKVRALAPEGRSSTGKPRPSIKRGPNP